ncbi:IQ domain-containing protein IQM2-like [Zingiber officinale]|uniref:IQ domain-containing protein IQM2-like n=1 Tax=Zingiber officinale TaxID=94328 RepID=UPI001C4D0712|nr:IQ domain-containing protein IQM2-like [Zingiber officinale]
MGMPFSFPVAGYGAMFGGLEALRSLCSNARSTLYSIRMTQGSLSLNEGETDYSSVEPDKSKEPQDDPKSTRITHLRKRSRESILIEPGNPKHEAAVKLQKVYKSFRTRRQLADCAVLVEQRWWKLLDFAMLRRSSVSFFVIEKQESAVSRWSRAKCRAAKVGKGLSKDEKAQKLALQHWLEAIDPRHRYGHNLQFYYDRWLQCESMQPFFYWLDVGEGKEVNLEQQCTRSKLLQQCIKYLGPQEREAYEVIIEDGKFMHRQSKQVLDTSDGPKGAKWIFVLSTSKKLYVGQKKKGTFQHSSFLAGGATSAAGQLVVENGVLRVVWPHSGHYRPTQKNFEEFMIFLQDNNVDITNVKKNPTEEDGDDYSRLRNNRSGLNLVEVNASVSLETTVGFSHAVSGKSISNAVAKVSSFEQLNNTSQADPKLGAEGKLFEESLEEESEEVAEEYGARAIEDNETLENSSHTDKLYIKGDEENSIPSEMILRRIHSKRSIESYQLGKKLSCRWTTGAGPRIGCVRDYPSELQFRALEQLNLSPRSTMKSRSNSPRLSKCHRPVTDAANT